MTTTIEAMARLKIRLLGPPQFVLDGEPITGFESDKVRALLAYLAVEANRPHRREALAALLWPESSTQAAKDNLRQALSNLRAAIGDRAATEGGGATGSRTATGDQDAATPFLLISRQTMQFDPHSDHWLDVSAFDELARGSRAGAPGLDRLRQARLERAVKAYRGEFLEGFTLGNSIAFEEWALFARERLHRLALDVLYHLTDAFLERGKYAPAQVYAQRQVELEPWREEAHRQLMRVLALGGQRSAALAQYETCRRIMVEKLGVEPAEETTALYGQILDGALFAQSSVSATPSPPAFPVPPPPCPYRGLFAFREQDAPFFFGRQAFTRRLIETVRRQPLVAVVGPSGSGKSSVAFAGLLPHLRREEQWAIADCRPGGQPFHALAVALAPLLGPQSSETERLAEIEKLAQALEGEDLSLGDIVERILAVQQRHGVSHLLLVVDQFEELYTLCLEEEICRRFVDELLAATDTAFVDSPLHVILTLRADFMGRALTHRPFADGLQNAIMILGPMSRQELSEAIENPAKLQGVAFEAGLMTRILDDVAGEPGNLPLLQFALASLWERQAGGQLTHAAYEAVGRVEGALTAHAERVYANLSPAEQEGVRRILVQMVRPGEGTEDTRRVATRAELGKNDWTLAQRLADARLAVTDRDESTGQEMVEVVHEALIRGWDRLRAWMNADRAFRAWQERMRAALRQWQASDEDAGALLRGLLLVEAENWMAERGADLGAAGRAFIQASLDAREARRAQDAARLAREAELERRDRKRLRALVVVLAVATVVALGLTLFAFHQREVAKREAAISQSLNLSTSAQVALAEGNTDLALALALAANQIDVAPPQAQLMLAEAAYAPGTRRRFVGHTAPVEDVAILPGCGNSLSAGCLALSASADATLILWDLETGRALRRFEGHTDVVHDVALLPAGDRAISASADGTLILWDLETGERLRTFTGHEDAVWSVAISPDGRTALSGAADGSLLLWNLEIGEPLYRLAGHEGAVYSVAISPDGRQALSGSADRGVILWDLETGEVRHEMAGVADTVAGSQEAIGHYDSVWGVAFRPDGRTALSVSQDEFAILWDLETGQLATRFDTNIGLFSLAMSRDGHTALLGTLDNRVLLLDLESGQLVLQLRGHTARVLAVALTPDCGNPLSAGYLALSGSATGALRLWNLYNGAEMRRIAYTDPLDPAAAAVAVSPDGRLGMTALWTGEISLWDYASGEEIHRLRGHTEMAFGGVLFFPDRRRAVSGAGDIFAASSDNSVRVWDVESGEELLRLEGHTDKVWDIDVSADGRFVASGSHDGSLRLWNLDSGESRVLLDVYPQAVRSVAFGPDGRFLVAGLAKGQSSNPDYSLRLLEVETGREVRRLAGHQELVGDVAFSPDGKLILSGSNEIAILWDAASGVEVHRLIGHAASVVAIAFSPDGRLAVSGAVDSSLLLWDVDAGVALRRYVGFTKPIVGVAFVPDGHSFFVAADDGAVHEYHVDTTQDDLLAWIAANRYVPELTCQQRARYRIEPLYEEGDTP